MSLDIVGIPYPVLCSQINQPFGQSGDQDPCFLELIMDTSP
jgi:hypothetical protein